MASYSSDSLQKSADLISFDNDVDSKYSTVSEIRKLFDPLFEHKPQFQSRSLAESLVAPTLAPVISPKPKQLRSLVKHFTRDVHGPVENSSPNNYISLTTDDIDEVASFMELFGSTHFSKKQTVAREESRHEHFTCSPGKSDDSYERLCQNHSSKEQRIVPLRHSQSSDSSKFAFIWNAQGSAEMKLFVDAVMIIRSDCCGHTHNSFVNGNVQSSSSFSFDRLVDTSMPYDPVYGELSSLCDSSVQQIPIGFSSRSLTLESPSWSYKTGAFRVANVYPVASTASQQLDICTPSHLKSIPRWSIPQIEVRITVHVEPRKVRARSMSNVSYLSNDLFACTDLSTATFKVNHVDEPRALPVTHRVRLTCDPNTTLVNELLMEVLTNVPLPPADMLNVDAYQLRLHGRTQLLHPDARLCDCNQVQVCHRLDLPLRLVLEPKCCLDNRDVQSQDSDVLPAFNPQLCFSKNLCYTPDADEVFITYNVFENALLSIRKTVSEDVMVRVGVDEWLKEIQRVISSLAQSVKAVLTVVCQSLAFSDVLNALGRVQTSLTEVLRDSSLVVHDPTIKHGLNAVATPSSLKECQTPSCSFPDRGVNSSKNTHLARGRVSEQSVIKLSRSLHGLKYHILSQLATFFQWREIGLRVNPRALEECAHLYRLKRPSAVIFNDDLLLKKDASQHDRVVQNADSCTEPFAVRLVAVHRTSTCQTILSAARRPGDSQCSPVFVDDCANVRFRSDANYYVILTLLYAGRRLGQVYPQDMCSYSPELSPGGGKSRSTLARDSFTSDPGRFQTIQPGFPKLLHFDQCFRFPGFGINQLPRETLLSISLITRKNQAADNSGSGVLIGWVNVPLFDAHGLLVQDTLVAGLWPPSEPMHEHRSIWSQPNRSSDCPVVQLSFPHYDCDIEFPTITASHSDQATSSSGYCSLITEAKQAISHAENAIFIYPLSADTATSYITDSLASYSEAASVSQRVCRSEKSHMILPSLKVGALTVGSTGNNDSTSSTCPLTSSVDCFVNTLPCPPAVAVEVLWNLRWCLVTEPSALVALLTAVLVTWPQEARGIGYSRNGIWSWTRLLQEVYRLLNVSAALTAGLALRLLAADVVDQGIRHWSVNSLARISPDILLLYLPQLVEAINNDFYLDHSGLASLLICRSASSMNFANALYWQLHATMHTAPVSSPLVPTCSVPTEWRVRRLLVLKSAVLYVASFRLSTAWQRQEKFIDLALDAAVAVKRSKHNNVVREETLNRHLCTVVQWLKVESCFLPPPRQGSVINTSDARVLLGVETKPSSLLIDLDDTLSPSNRMCLNASVASWSQKSTVCPYDLGLRMPYDPGLLTCCLDIAACTYFSSYTCPLRLVFHAIDDGAEPIMVMFKVGDDLRQDALIAQLSVLMDRIWLDAGLDLRMIHFRILPTGDCSGLIELVSECSTLRQIQQHGGGLTGPFKETVITKWFQSQNTTELDYRRALDNFLHSLAGCCVMTYVLGIGDRHNDNIMIRFSGHLFHVDFSKVFGNVQTFAGIKRDRVPFVLTADMLHVLQTYSNELNDQTAFGSTANPAARKPCACSNEGVQLFIDLCCEAYNLLRRSSYALLSILDLGLSMNIPGITRDSVRYVMRALKLDLSEQQASQHFTELIRKTLQSRMPALNFFVHGLAQVKQSTGGGAGATVSGGSALSGVASFGSYTSLSSSVGSCGSLSPLTRSDVGNQLRCSHSSSALSTRSAHAVTGQVLSFSPKQFNCMEDGIITAVMVEAAVKKRSSEKETDYYFPMSVWREHCRVPSRIFRRVGDFLELCAVVRDTLAGSMVSHTLQQPMHSLTSCSLTSVQMQNNVQQLVDYLLEEDDSISKSDLVYTFFHSLLFDEKFAAEEAVDITAISQSSFWVHTPPQSDSQVSGEASSPDSESPFLTSANNTTTDNFHVPDVLASGRSTERLPSLQLQFCLDENMQHLNVVIMHGRALFIPGTYDPPDVYVKLYLLSGRRKKTTKRKTHVSRRTTDPTFYTTFTYDITAQDVQFGFLEVTAWHAHSLGENVSLGHVYVPIRSLRPGSRITQWYALTTDWHVV